MRQDLMLNFKPGDDDRLSFDGDLSARWKSTLTAPRSGRYNFRMEASGELEVFVNGKKVMRKGYVGSKNKECDNFELVLKEGETCNIVITGRTIILDHPVRFLWKMPYDEYNTTPQSLAADCDMAIIFIRDDSSSEGKDREGLHLSDAHSELITAICKTNPNTVVLLGSAAPLVLNEVAMQAKALLNVWIAGECEAQAISNILTGKTNPSGKTSVTFFADESQLPALDDYDVTHGRSYQYFKGDVMYPFGYGLSYTNYSYSPIKVSSKKLKGNKILKASVKVTNSGNYNGEEVVQCYISSPLWISSGLQKRLVGYKRVPLKAGETKTVEFKISSDALQRWDATNHLWVSLSGDYTVTLAPHSQYDNQIRFTYEN